MSYDLLIEIGWKSVVTSGVTLLLLRALSRRSAAERSLIATAGVLVTLFLPLMAIFGPRWRLESPAAVPQFLVQDAPAALSHGAATAPTSQAPAAVMPPLGDSSSAWLASDTIGWLLYFVPAALLLLTTVAGVLRLYVLRARSEILMEQDWLAALARAQRRMHFKYGTALLVSKDLDSPISWGFFRPTIVLNNDALQSTLKAEPIIAHELAHVARLDWAKLILGRAACAIFWFNPLVWLLVRESHQLCEEAADDAVLTAEVPCGEYASLLVEVATHENRGLLVAANGVAPGPASLKQRVARILNPQLSRHPARIGWAGACIGTAFLAFAPLAAIAPVASGALTTRQETSISPVVAVPAATNPDSDTPDAGPGVAAAIVSGAEELTSSSSVGSADLATIAAASVTATALPAAAPDPPARAEVPVEPGTALSLPSFRAVELHGGGQVVLRYGTRHQVSISRGSLRPQQVSVDERGRLFIRCGHGCTAESLLVEVATPHVQAIAIEGGGKIAAKGSFPLQGSVSLAIHGGGTLDARDLNAKTVAASTHGGGTILTQARDQLAASTLGGGEIRYWGDGNVLSSIKGGGKIEPGGGT